MLGCLLVWFLVVRLDWVLLCGYWQFALLIGFWWGFGGLFCCLGFGVGLFLVGLVVFGFVALMVALGNFDLVCCLFAGFMGLFFSWCWFVCFCRLVVCGIGTFGWIGLLGFGIWLLFDFWIFGFVFCLVSSCADFMVSVGVACCELLFGFCGFTGFGCCV